MAGLEQVIDYVKNLRFDEEDIEYLRSLHIFEEDFLNYLKDFKFSGDIYAIPEGSIIFPREPLVKVIAPVMEAQLLETALLNIVNHQCLVATKASRVCDAAEGDGVMEFGLRRAQGPDAGTYGARAAVIGGCNGTSNVLAGKLFNVPVKGTHAHSWIMLSWVTEIDFVMPPNVVDGNLVSLALGILHHRFYRCRLVVIMADVPITIQSSDKSRS